MKMLQTLQLPRRLKNVRIEISDFPAGRSESVEEV